MSRYRSYAISLCQKAPSLHTSKVEWGGEGGQEGTEHVHPEQAHHQDLFITGFAKLDHH